jgi:hypothetical protein
MSGLAGLATIITNVVAIAKGVVGDLLVDVSHTAWAGQDGFGRVIPGATVVRQALVEEYVRTYHYADGTAKDSRHLITFLEPVDLTLQDILTLADGTTGPILSIEGLFNPQVQRYVTSVAMGVHGKSSGGR